MLVLKLTFMYRSGLYRYFVCTESDYTDIDFQCTESGCNEKTYRKCMYRNCPVPKANYPGRPTYNISWEVHNGVNIIRVKSQPNML